MDNAAFGNVSWLEFVWIVLMAVGACVSGWNINEALKDRRAMHFLHTNGPSGVIVDEVIAADTSRMIQFLLLLGLGIFGAFTPRNPVTIEVHGFYWWYRLWTYLAILGVGALLLFNSLNAARARHKALELHELQG